MNAPRRLRRLLGALAGGVFALSALVGAGAGPASAAASPAATGAAALMKSYNSGTGQIGTGWWNSAVALSTIETYQQRTGDSSYASAMSGAFSKHQSTNFENEYMDDTGWWALAWVQAYDITGNTAYLQMARTDADYIHGYWDSTCGGGVWWSTAKSYKNAIPNELFLQLTASLHNRIPGDTTYLSWADQEWNWFNGSGMINSSHLVNDGLTSSCQNNGSTTWTYNQGVILAGLSELSRATGNAALLTTARQIADAATSSLSVNGILTESCEASGCNADRVSFKGIFIRGLRALATAADTTAYDAWLNAQSASIQAHDTNSSGFGVSWAGPISAVTSSTTASAEDAVVAALPLTATPTGAVTSGIAGKCLDDPNDSATAGAKAQLWDCNAGPSQEWTVNGQTLRVQGLCLDIAGAGTANGTLVQEWTCNGGANQVWKPVNGAVTNPATGKCLDDPHSSTTNGTQLQIWDCNGGANQKWIEP